MVGSSSNRLLLAVVIAVLVFGFTPISRALLSSVHGSFAQTPYSSLALATPSAADAGFPSGEPVPVELANHTGRTTTYRWSATESGALISLGEETLRGGQTTAILVPSRGAVTGTLRISLTGTSIFVTVPILKS